MLKKKVDVVFLSADPTRTLSLDKDVQKIQENVRAAEYRDVLRFDFRPAARIGDVVQALYETKPQIVHFSGHGDVHGVMLMAADGHTPAWVSGDDLEELFTAFRNDIRVVVLSACSTAQQAQAIANGVGCAIGTPATIADEAAIVFNAEFYRALAFGKSVKSAHENACAVMAAHDLDQVRPELRVRPGVDAAALILIRDGRAVRRRMMATAAVLFVACGAAFGISQELGPQGEALGEAPASIPRGESGQPGKDGPSGAGRRPAEDLALARELHRAGNYAASFPLFERAAQADIPEAMGFLGMAYLGGEGTERSRDGAAHWLSLAAHRGDARGMIAYGQAFEEGFGVGQSYHWARHWYEAAAREKNDTAAMRNLARLHRDGRGVARDHSLALSWYRKAVDAGSVDAMVDVGHMYAEGVNGRRDVHEALRWQRRAAAAGSFRAMHAVGRLYQEAGNYAEAQAWYQRAADAGSADAMNDLGVLYQNGWGVPADPAEALRWYRRAAAAGSALARETLAAFPGG